MSLRTEHPVIANRDCFVGLRPPRKDGVGVIASRTKQSPPVIASEARSNLNVLEVEPPKEVQPPKIENQKPSTWAVCVDFLYSVAIIGL